jgi:hypothetical protein
LKMAIARIAISSSKIYENSATSWSCPVESRTGVEKPPTSAKLASNSASWLTARAMVDAVTITIATKAAAAGMK